MTVSHLYTLTIGIFLIVTHLLAATPAQAHDADVCYAVADSGDTLVTIDKDGTNFTVVGNTGTSLIEAIAMRPGIPHILYAANAGEFGTLNLTTGAFTSISSSFGTGSGADGDVTFSDIDSLAFDPRTGTLWGAHRRSGQEDILIQIDPDTGIFVPNGFRGSACGTASPCDYVVIKSNVAPVNHPDIDDIAIDPLTGTMYAIANSGGGGDDLVIIDTNDGTITNVGPLGVDDMEGFSNLNDGVLYGTTGSAGSSPNHFWTVNINTGNATEIGTFGSGSDYESVSCLTEAGNVINGTVFVDDDDDGFFDPPGEGGLAGVTVRLYIDENNDGLVDANDILLTTETSDLNGHYQFLLGIQDNFVIEVDTNALPNGATLTTDNVEEADFASYGNTDNDNNFGLSNLPALSVIKTSNAPGNMVAAGDTITYTIQIQNLSATTQTGVTVSDPLPTHTTYVAQSTAAILPTLTTVASDDFESTDYNGGTGWLGNWTEVNESNGEGSNDVRVQTNQSSWRLKVQDDDKGAFRRVDLSGVTTGTLTFDFRRRNLDAGESIGIYASGTASTACATDPTSLGWVLIGTLEGPAHDSAYTSTSLSLPASVFTADAGICFITPDNAQENTEKFFFDNITITGATGTTTRDNIPGGSNPDLASGVPANLVQAADNFQMAANDTLTVTFQVQVDDPLGSSVTEISNGVSVTTDQETTPITASVTDYVPHLDSYEGDNNGMSTYSVLDELYLRDPHGTGNAETAFYTGGLGYPPNTAFDVIYYDAGGNLVFADADASSDGAGFLQSAYTVADGLDTEDQTFAYGQWTAVVIANGATQPATLADVNSSNSLTSDTFEVRSWSATQFTDASGTPVDDYDVPGGETTAYLTITDQDQNTDPSSIESITVTITDTETGDSEMVTLFETGANTGVFANNSGGSRFGLTLADNCGSVVADDGTMCVDASVPSSLDVTFNDPGDPGDSSNDTATTPVTLQLFQSWSGAIAGKIWFRWQAATETGNIGYYLQVALGDQWITINPHMIPSKAIHSAELLTYRYRAMQVEGTRFRLLALDQQGNQTLHGPFDLGTTYGRAHSGRLIDWKAIRAERRAFRAQSWVSTRTSGAGPQVSEVALRVQKTGVYRAAFADLATAGFDLTDVTLSDLALLNRGQAVPCVVVAPEPLTGADGYIEFYGVGIDDSLYTRTNVYVLQVDPERARRVEVIAGAPSEATPSTVARNTVTVDRNLAYNFASPTHDPWYEAEILAFTDAATQRFSFDVEALAPGAVTLEVELHGGTTLPQNPDHHVVAELNGVTVADVHFDGLQAKTIRMQVPAGVLRDGKNLLNLTLPGDTGADFDLVYLNRYQVTYTRSLTAPDGYLNFSGSGAAFHVRGLPGTDVLVYRIGTAAVSRVQTQVTEDDQDTARYSAIFSGDAEPAQYVVTLASAALTPEITPLIPGRDLTQGEAQFLIITHPLFREALAPFVRARQAQGYTIKVIDVGDIYAQFGDHIVDAGAIRDYIAYAHQHLGAEFVLLVGGDTYDYLDYLDQGAVSFIPSPYAQTDAIVRFAPVDALYGDIDGNNVPDLPIGRWPVRSQADAAVLVDKTLNYTRNALGKRQAIFVADAFDAAQNLSFTQDSEAMVAQLPSAWQVNRVYLDTQTVDQARGAIRDRINAGAALSSFVGHSGPQRWTFSGVWNHEDVKALTNIRRPTVVAQWGCWNTYYVSPTSDTLGHVFLLSPAGGAAAVLGASTLTQAASERGLALELYGRLFAPGKSLGQAIVEAKQAYAQRYPAHLDVLLGWTLLGDPTLPVTP